MMMSLLFFFFFFNLVWLKSLYLIFFYLSFSHIYIIREMIFIQPFCYNFWNNPLSHTLIMLLLSLSIALVFVSRHTFLSILLVVPYISCTKSGCSNNIPHIKNTNFSCFHLSILSFNVLSCIHSNQTTIPTISSPV